MKTASPRPRKILALLGAACLAASLACASAHAAPEAAFEAAYRVFDAAAAEPSAAEQAAEAFEALFKAEPGNPVLMAYLGASTAMRSQSTMLPWKKMGFAEDGLAWLDKALAMLSPAHDAPLQHGTSAALEVKFICANTFLAVPGFMNRGARGAKLLNEVLASPLLAGTPLPFRGLVWMRAAKLAQAESRPADARRWLEQVIRQGAPQADAARGQLKEIPA